MSICVDKSKSLIFGLILTKFLSIVRINSEKFSTMLRDLAQTGGGGWLMV